MKLVITNGRVLDPESKTDAVCDVLVNNGTIEAVDRPGAFASLLGLGDVTHFDAHGMLVVPGLIDMHGHIGGTEQGTPAEYVFKLWMAHGITTIRDPSCGNGLQWVLDVIENLKLWKSFLRAMRANSNALSTIPKGESP